MSRVTGLGLRSTVSAAEGVEDPESCCVAEKGWAMPSQGPDLRPLHVVLEVLWVAFVVVFEHPGSWAPHFVSGTSSVVQHD